jgi:hypothetical protein
LIYTYIIMCKVEFVFAGDYLKYLRSFAA